MRARILFTALSMGLVLMIATSVPAQTDPINVKFEVDGKIVHQPFKIQVSLNGLVLEPQIENGSFIFPSELLSQEKVSVRFISGKHDLFYENVYLTKFNGEMIFGVDNKPFGAENLPSQPISGKRLFFIYYIHFEPKDACGTTMIMHVYK